MPRPSLETSPLQDPSSMLRTVGGSVLCALVYVGVGTGVFFLLALSILLVAYLPPDSAWVTAIPVGFVGAYLVGVQLVLCKARALFRHIATAAFIYPQHVFLLPLSLEWPFMNPLLGPGLLAVLVVHVAVEVWRYRTVSAVPLAPQTPSTPKSEFTIQTATKVG